jgi:ATP-independent RNA helicase DbpA
MSAQNPLFASALSTLKIPALNPMQEAAVAAIVGHENVLLLSDTGSGKTIAFLLPLLQLLEKDNPSTQALIIVPSRELALQIEGVWRGMATGYKVTPCYGGHKREIEELSLTEAPALIIGTPGRLADHMRRGNIKPDGIRTLVMDEFDKTLESGFVEEVQEIVSALTGLQKRVLTSATEGADIPDFLGFQSPHRVDFLSSTASAALAVQIVSSTEKDKVETVFRLICQLGGRPMVVFCNHRESVDRLSELLKERGILNAAYHGAMEQWEREAALGKFRNGTAYVLVTTDLASRGLDVPHIRYIIHYHLPDTAESYTHRNGRTARVDTTGTAILILGPDEKLPAYVPDTATTLELREGPVTLPDVPKWTTLVFAAGKKDKLNKVDVVGFLTGPGGARKEDIGLIESKDFVTYAAVRRSSMSTVLHNIKDQKIKGRKIKVEVAK